MPESKKSLAPTLIVLALLVLGLIVLMFSPYGQRPEDRVAHQIARQIKHSPLPDPSTPARDALFVVFDTETTGVDPNYDRLVELAMVKIQHGRVIEQKSRLVNPERFVPPEAEAVHHISTDMLKNQPTFPDAYRAFAAFSAGAVLVAHNARFDVNFVHMEAERHNLPQLSNPVIDSLALFRAIWPGLPSYQLKALADRLGVDEGAFHRALDDSVYTALIFNRALKDLPPETTLADLFEKAGGAHSFSNY